MIKQGTNIIDKIKIGNTMVPMVYSVNGSGTKRLHYYYSGPWKNNKPYYDGNNLVKRGNLTNSYQTIANLRACYTGWQDNIFTDDFDYYLQFRNGYHTYPEIIIKVYSSYHQYYGFTITKKTSGSSEEIYSDERDRGTTFLSLLFYFNCWFDYECNLHIKTSFQLFPPSAGQLITLEHMVDKNTLGFNGYPKEVLGYYTASPIGVENYYYHV